MLKQIDDTRQHVVASHFTPESRWRSRSRLLPMAIRQHWLSLLLWTATAASAAGACVIFVVSWPWSAPAGTPDLSGVVVSCAQVVALGVLVLSAIASPLQKAGELGPGFTSAIVQRPGPWLTGALVAPATVFLVWLATRRPDADATVGAGLVTAALFGATWAMSRRTAQLMDPLQLAKVISQHQQRRIRLFADASERVARRMTSKSVPSDVAEPYAATQRAAGAAGGIRHAQHAVLWAAAHGREYEAFIMWSAMVDEVAHHAAVHDGAIGRQGGMTDVLTSTIRPLCQALDASGNHLEARLSAESLLKVSALGGASPDTAYARMAIRHGLHRLAQTSWADDESEVPAAVPMILANSVQKLIAVGAFEDVGITVQVLFDLLAEAARTGRIHIEQAASEAAVIAFGWCATEPPVQHVDGYLRQWRLWAADGARPSLTSNRIGLFRPGQKLVPGTDLHGVGLQDVIVALDDPARWSAASDAISTWLSRISPALLTATGSGGFEGGPIADAVTLLYACALQGVHLSGEAPTREKQGVRLLQPALDALSRAAPESRDALLRDDGFVEMLWSLLLAAATLERSPSLLRSACNSIRPWLDLQGPHPDAYVVRFIAGVLIAAGDDVAVVDGLVEGLAPSDLWRFGGIDFHIPPLGRANSANRNRVQHYSSAVDAVNQWALESFPELGP